MMPQNLLNDIVSRRLWPIPVLAVAVAIAAPLLFLKPAPEGAPPAAAPAPAAAPEGKLPARAQRLLATSDAAAGKGRRASGTSHDPFAPPAGRTTTAEPAATATTAKTETAKAGSPTGATTTTAEPVPVVITNADGSVPRNDDTPAPPISGDDAPELSASSAAVDVRFGKTSDTKLRREIPRLQTFVAGRNIVAIFVKYSPNRDKAVFAISPSTQVSGDVECRRKEGLCRYVDIPAGQHARLTWRTANGTLMTRRIDVVRIHRASSSPPSDAKVASATRGASTGVAKCLLGKLLALDLRAQVAVNDCDE